MPRKRKGNGWKKIETQRWKKIVKENIGKTAAVAENNIPSSEEEMDSEAIIDLGDEDTPETDKQTIDITEKQIVDIIEKQSKCINYMCKNGKDLLQPTQFCLNYFRVKNTSDKQKVCKECFLLALEQFSRLVDRLESGEAIVKEKIPLRDEIFALDDSDDEEASSKNEMENTPIDVGTLKMLQENFDEVFESTMSRLNLPDQVEKSLAYLEEQIDMDDGLDDLKAQVALMSKQVDVTLYSLYGDLLRVDNKLLDPVDIVDLESNYPRLTNKNLDLLDIPSDLPLNEPLVKPKLVLGHIYYAKRSGTGSSWIKVILKKLFPPGSKVNGKHMATTVYQVSRLKGGRQRPTDWCVSGKGLAMSESSRTLLEVGTRVIASFHFQEEHQKEAYFSGTVGEFPSSFNKYRYLIFFDDGYAQYVHYKKVFLVYESSKEVWNDVDLESRSFIKKYLTNYPNRSMVQLMVHQRIRTEYKGKWYNTKIEDIDCSLVLINFEVLKLKEWIYRGSNRLNTMYKEEQAANNRLQHKYRNARTAATPKTGEPYVQYTTDDVVFVSMERPAVQSKPEARAVAKKSTKTLISVAKPEERTSSSTANQKENQNSNSGVLGGAPGKLVFFTPKKKTPSSKKYEKHVCAKYCQKFMETTLSKLRGYSPLAKPLLCGFYRIDLKTRNRRTVVMYKTPCGRSLRTMNELHLYLQMTQSDLTVDLFTFDPTVRLLAEFILKPNEPLVKDLSNGLEEVQIPLVNHVDVDLNDFVNYSTKRMPREGVNLNLDPEFLVGCDCTDDCTDKQKCSCWQLTLQGASYLNKNIDEIGYQYRRLLDPVFTGIFECNSRCKCAKTCLNRVVQNPLQHKLQVFKTVNRGWGIRCINDIPLGSFICIYAGCLLTDQMANEGGQHYGDEYYAELDYIESVESAKEGFEEEAYESDEQDEAEPSVQEKKSSTYFQGGVIPDKSYKPSAKDLACTPTNESDIKTRLRRRDDKKDKDEESVDVIDDEEVQREPSSFTPANDNYDEEESQYPSVRSMFGKHEKVYIMDAKTTGNIGRYLNHSCDPNVFVQNVFVDTHDLRFPWVSFFALEYIRAGTELTWNYNYDIGSVQGKEMKCRCGSAYCRGRLL